MDLIAQSQARAYRTAPPKDEASDSAQTAGPADQQTQGDFASNEAALKAVETAVAQFATRVAK